MRKQPNLDQRENAKDAVKPSRLSRLLPRLFAGKSRRTEDKKPLAVAHLYGLPRPGAV